LSLIILFALIFKKVGGIWAHLWVIGKLVSTNPDNIARVCQIWWKNGQKLQS